MAEQLHTAQDQGVQFRAHHFAHLADASARGEVVSARDMTDKMLHNRGAYTSADVDLSKLKEGVRFTTSPAYAIDLIGDTVEDAETYRQGFQTALEQFSALDDDGQVTFNTKPDALCGSCIFGNHCEQKDAGDVRAINVLKWVSEGLGIDAGIEITGTSQDGSYRMVATAHAARTMIELFKNADPQYPGQSFNQTSVDASYEPFELAQMNNAQYVPNDKPKSWF